MMIYTDNAINILTVNSFKGIGRAWITRNFKGNEEVTKIIQLLNSFLKEDEEITLSHFEFKRQQIIKQVENLNGYADGIVAIGDTDFPAHRGKVKSSEQPIFIFYKGDISLLSQKNLNIAVIGLLDPDEIIKATEQKLVSELVKNGATILSGLALGCDTIAHEQALRSNGKTIAILPGPLNSIMPAANKNLAGEIVKQKGLLISEYFTDNKSKMELSGRYQERDRLQALYSDCIILSASYAKNNLGNDSGSRLAMGYAKDYSIPRAVIYNAEKDKTNPMFELNRQLIKERGNITTINPDNLTATLKKIIKIKQIGAQSVAIQTRMF